MVKKVGGLRGGEKSPSRKTKRVGAIKQDVKETASCGCVVEYPDFFERENGSKLGMGKPRHVKPCKHHERMIPLWKADENAKMLGGLTPGSISKGTTRGHRQCGACSGRLVDGNWIHSPECSLVVVLWDFDDSRWRCPFDCKGVRLSTSRTHIWNCQFWREHSNAVPF